MFKVFGFLAILAAAMPSAVAIAAPVTLIPVSYTSPNRAAVDWIKAGHHDCPNCDLSGADLTNTCVKKGDVQGAKFDGAKLVLMCMSYANFTGASFRRADLAGANLAHAIVDGADFTGATLSITSIKGTDLRKVRGLTQSQVDAACGDAATRLPDGLKVHTCS